jgi:Dehydratase medium subunit
VIVALLAAPEAEPALAAAFEEEGVPLRWEQAAGDALPLARDAARRSPLGLGVGGDAQRLALVLAAAPARPYLEARATEGRAFGHAVARVAARRPLSVDIQAAEAAPRFASE